MHPLNIKVEGNPNSLRDIGEWLSKVGHGTHDSGTDVRAVRGISEGEWKGQAAEAFRDAMSKTGPAIDKVVGDFRELRQGLDKHADNLDTVKARMAQAHRIASEAGLEATDIRISPPGPAPARPQPLSADKPCTMADRNAYHDAVTAQQAYARKVQGYYRCADVVDGARKIETDSQDALLDLIGKIVGSDPFSIANTIAGLAGATTAQSSAFRAAAEMWKTEAASWAKELGRGGIPINDPSWRTALRNHTIAQVEHAENLRNAQATRLARAVDKLPPWAKKYLTASLGGNLKPTGNPVLANSIRVLQKIPGLSFLLTSGSVALNIGSGKGVTQSAVSGYGGMGAGIIGTALVSNPYGWAAIGIGTVAQVGVGTLIDEMFEAGRDPDGLRDEQIGAVQEFADYEAWKGDNRSGITQSVAEVQRDVGAAREGAKSSGNPVLPGFLGNLIG